MTDPLNPPSDPAPVDPAVNTPADPPAAPDWLSTLDDDGKKYVETKGFKAPSDALAALKGYEPPESPDKYELPIPDGESDEFAKAVAPIFHKAGLSATQAKALAEGWNEMQTAQRAQAAEAEAAAEREAGAMAERQQNELKREWGDKFDANVELSRRAIRSGMAAAGLNEDAASAMIDSLEKAHGYGVVHKFFSALGQPLSEAKAVGMGTPSVAAKSFYANSNMNP